MKAKPDPLLTIEDAVYEAVAHVEDGTDADVMRFASKVFGKRITKEQFDRAIKALPRRGP
jgi:hypothetical protein